MKPVALDGRHIRYIRKYRPDSPSVNVCTILNLSLLSAPFILANNPSTFLLVVKEFASFFIGSSSRNLRNEQKDGSATILSLNLEKSLSESKRFSRNPGDNSYGLSFIVVVARKSITSIANSPPTRKPNGASIGPMK